MQKRQLLFVTYLDEHLDEGISYAIELARALVEDISLLLVQKKDTVRTKVENMMAGIAFAEEGEHETARTLVADRSNEVPPDMDGKITEMVVASAKAGIQLKASTTDKDVVPGIRSFLKEHDSIDKVILSPAVTENEMLTTRDLNRLVRTASRPIVTMTRQSLKALKKDHAEDGQAYRYEPSVSY